MATLLSSIIVYILPVIVGFLVLKWIGKSFVADETLQTICWTTSYGTQSCRLQCPRDSFSLVGMETCTPLLDCTQIRETIKLQGLIGAGAVKQVYLGVWCGNQVAVNKLGNAAYKIDFQHGLAMLRQLQLAVRVTQIIGVCEEEDMFVTEFYSLGSAEKLESMLLLKDLRQYDTISRRFGLCVQYVHILHQLHNSPLGVKVMCDSNDLTKTLSQFLVHDSFSLVLNDVEALPQVDKDRGLLAKCGHHELVGDFVAPEQLWPFEDKDFIDTEMPGYDEKVDIWKIPDVCDCFIGNAEGGSKLRMHLLPVHMQCKSEVPSERPTAREILDFYKDVSQKMKFEIS